MSQQTDNPSTPVVPVEPTSEQWQKATMWSPEVEVKFHIFQRWDDEAKVWVFWVPAIGRFTQSTDEDPDAAIEMFKMVCEQDKHLPAPTPVPVVAAQDSDKFIPGNYRCGQCGFVLVKSVMSVADGNIYANTRQDYELCPNDGGPMRPITWKEGYEEGCKMQAELLKRLEATTPSPPQFICRARKQGTVGGNGPADCDWPRCGCDHYANKVLDTIDESGFDIVPKPGVSREPISAEQFLAANFYINGLGELSFMHKTGCRYFSLPEVLEAYARAAARTCETKEKP